MPDITQARQALIARILEGDGRAPSAQRRAAFDDAGLAGPVGALADQIARRPWTVTAEDLGAAKAAGLSEDQIFELVICAAVGQASRQYDAARAALDAATRKE